VTDKEGNLISDDIGYQRYYVAGGGRSYRDASAEIDEIEETAIKKTKAGTEIFITVRYKNGSKKVYSVLANHKETIKNCNNRSCPMF
jgi:hypothetical protein